MQGHKNRNQDFDSFRQERKRMRAKIGPQPSVLGYENQALRELEQVEEREVRDKQLTREVHDFFAAATKKAAAIVERVAHEAEKEVGERIEGDVESFLMDSLSRMNTFVMAVLQQRRFQGVAETQVEPHIGNIVGQYLDEFRFQGTTDTREDHIGQDPFDTALEDVQREFRAVVADMAGEAPAALPIEEHLVAETNDDVPQDADSVAEADDVEQEPLAADEGQHEEPEPAPARAPRAKAAAAPVDDFEEEEEAIDPEVELEQFKNALRALVRQGVLQKEEARAAWTARLVKMGRA